MASNLSHASAFKRDDLVLSRSESLRLADALDVIIARYGSRRAAARALHVTETALQLGTSRRASLKMTRRTLTTIGMLTGIDTSRMGEEI